jgi:hypothetical protein
MKDGFDSAAVFGIDLARRTSDVLFSRATPSRCEISKIINNLTFSRGPIRSVKLGRQRGPNHSPQPACFCPFGQI